MTDLKTILETNSYLFSTIRIPIPVRRALLFGMQFLIKTIGSPIRERRGCIERIRRSIKTMRVSMGADKRSDKKEESSYQNDKSSYCNDERGDQNDQNPIFKGQLPPLFWFFSLFGQRSLEEVQGRSPFRGGLSPTFEPTRTP